MVSRVVSASLALVLSAHAAIDFTPLPYVVELESIKSTQPGFRDGKLTVTFAPPSGWSVDGGGAVLQLHPSGTNSALARVETRPLPAGPLGSEDSLKEIHASLVPLLPPQAQDVRWSPDIEKDPVLLNRHGSLRAEATYTVLGQGFRASIIACYLDKQQLLFALSARERDYPKLYEEWRRSLFTWQGLQ